MLAHFLFALTATAGLTSAQSLSLSSSCTTSLKGMLTSSDAACLNPGALLSFFIGSNQSIPNTVNSWLTGLCSTGSCSNTSLAAVVSNITDGCATDLGSIGVDSESLTSTITSVVQQVYPTAREVACLKDDTANQLCVTQTLVNLESVVGQLSLDDLSFFNLFDDVGKLLASGISDLACTSCVKEAFTLTNQAFPDVVSSIDGTVEDVCGASFLDGEQSENITQTAVNENFSTKSDNGALGREYRAGVSLIFLWSVFVIFS